MKKILALIACLLLCVSVFAACSTATGTPESSDSSAELSQSESSEASESSDESKVESSDAANDSEDPLDQLVDASKDQIQEMAKSFEDVLSIETFGRDGNTFVYKFSYKSEVDVASAKTELDSTLESQTSTYENVADSMKLMGIEDPKVSVEYYSMDGELITSKEYTSSK